MLVCGCINPPPEGAGYNGVYFSDADNMAEKAKALAGTPLWVEHNKKTSIGKVLQGMNQTVHVAHGLLALTFVLVGRVDRS